MPQLNKLPNMETPFEIIHISSKKDWRGGEQQVFYLWDNLRIAGVRQWIITPENSVMQKKVMTIAADVVVPFRSFSFKPFYVLALSNCIKRIAKKYPHAIIHTHDSDAHTAATLAFITGNLRNPLVVSRRVDFAVGLNAFSRFKYNHRSVKAILCVSDEVKRITGQAIKDKSHLYTVYSGIDASKFDGCNRSYLRTEYKVPSNVKIVGNVAALAPHKDYPTFLNAVKLMHEADKDILFFIIGSGPLEKEIKSRIDSQKMNDYVIMTGFISPVEPALCSLDLLLFSSKTEGLGTTILDAFAAEVPVCSTNAGGIAEIAINNQTALTCDPEDFNSLAENGLRLLSDDVLRERLVANGKKLVMDKSHKNTAKNTYEVYKSLVR